jgi:hypothetical protein
MMSPDNEGLSGEEARRLERAMASFDRGPVTLPPWVRGAIMRRIRERPAPVWQRVWSWLRFARPVQASPLALALLLVVVIASSVVVGSRIGREPQAPVAGVTQRTARFALVDPRAASVTVTGTFASWDPAGVPLRRLADGLWVVELPLTPGIYQYVFVVDGKQWRPDPNAVWSVDDGMGQRNSVMVVPEIQQSL